MNNWVLWLIAGIVSLIGGIVALMNPLAATLTAVALAGWIFMIVGVLTLVSAFGDQGWGGRILSVLMGILMLVLGFNLIANPLEGTVSLTLATAIMLLVVGVTRIILAFSARAKNLRMVLILSGAISLLLAVMILANFPQSAVVVLGIFLAVELISNGISLIVLSLARKSGEEA